MHTFFAGSDIILPKGHTFLLDEEESKHASKAMRLRNSDEIRLCDGKGNVAIARIIDVRSIRIPVEIVHHQFESISFPSLHLAVAPTKNPDRYEWFIEKATELGVAHITPLVCENSERSRIRHERLSRIAISALKQSERAYMPQIHESIIFDDFITSVKSEQKCIAWCETGKENLWQKSYNPGKNSVLLIGPEGDFSAKEVNLAIKNDFRPVSLGKARLRTETAALFVAAAHACINENFETNE